VTFDDDSALRTAAFEHVRRLFERNGVLSKVDLDEGFQFAGQRVPIYNPQRGIFKPSRMRFLLSIKTVFPRQGNRVWYDDQRQVHRQILSGDETVDYAFMGTDPNASDNRWLRDAWLNRIPIIYFLGVAPGRYQAILPSFISAFDPEHLRAKVAFGNPNSSTLELPDSAPDRQYALRVVRERLHQASFRQVLLDAYGRRCALSGLPEPQLLDAAHIISDGDQDLGQPSVNNGILLSKIHHAAFDAHLVGIDPDYRIHISERLMAQKDGPMLESLKALHGSRLILPARHRDHPDRERLDRRFEIFRASA